MIRLYNDCLGFAAIGQLPMGDELASAVGKAVQASARARKRASLSPLALSRALSSANAGATYATRRRRVDLAPLRPPPRAARGEPDAHQARAPRCSLLGRRAAAERRHLGGARAARSTCPRTSPPQGAAYIADALASGGPLATLELQCCEIDSEGCQALARPLERNWCPSLTDLDLSDGDEAQAPSSLPLKGARASPSSTSRTTRSARAATPRSATRSRTTRASRASSSRTRAPARSAPRRSRSASPHRPRHGARPSARTSRPSPSATTPTAARRATRARPTRPRAARSASTPTTRASRSSGGRGGRAPGALVSGGDLSRRAARSRPRRTSAPRRPPPSRPRARR